MAEPSKAFGLGLKSLVIDDRDLGKRVVGMGSQPCCHWESSRALMISQKQQAETLCGPAGSPVAYRLRAKDKAEDCGRRGLHVETRNTHYSADPQTLHGHRHNVWALTQVF